MFSAGQYQSTEKGYETFCYVSENIIYSNINFSSILCPF